MKKLYTLLFVAICSVTFGQTTISQWNFDAATPAAAMLPTTGSGTFTTIGGVEDNLTSGAMPAGNPSTGKAYSIKTFPDASVGSGTAGFQFNVSTVGYSGITITFDPRSSPTGSKWQQFEYSINGTAWVVLSNNNGAIANDFLNPVTLTFPATANNNANFKFRIVSIFAPSTTSYVAVGPAAYGTTGAWRLDNFTVTGTTLGVKSNDIAGLNIYPNPVTNGTLFINTDANAERNVTVFDVLGKQVLKVTTSNNAINVANLNAGVYIVKVTEEGKTATRKLVIR